jgi:hypothetical protein
MEQVKERQLSDAELDAKEYRDFEREYAQWCRDVELGSVAVINNSESRKEK